jgi:hypothetical protein
MRRITPIAFSLALGSLLMVSASAAQQPGPELRITFTGVTVFKKIADSPPVYKILAPDVESHSAYIRFPDIPGIDAGEFEASPAFRCGTVTMKHVTLKHEGLTLEPAAKIVDGPLPTGALTRLASLKSLAGNAADFDQEYDQPNPKPFRVATQFRADRGALIPVVEPDYDPIYWAFRTEGGEDCGVQICGASGIQLIVHFENAVKSAMLVSSRDKRRTLSVPLVNGKTTEVTIGNSRHMDIKCLGIKSNKPDIDFLHHYETLNGSPRKCVPYPTNVACAKKFKASVSMMSFGGSNCLGAQWP